VEDGFVDALLAAPVGVTWLGLLEADARDDVPWRLIPADTHPDAVAKAAEAVRTGTLGSVLAPAINGGYMEVGPWIPYAAEVAATAYRGAEGRRPIAEALADRFGQELHASVDPDAQQWWHSDHRAEGFFAKPRFQAFDEVYGAGQFTQAGVWTVSDPPPETHADLAGAWEIEPGPVSRWRLPVRPGARVLEIHRPDDWVSLVARYPASARPNQECWELPGPNNPLGGLSALMAVPGQRAARTSIRRHLVPDWGRLAHDYDGVHLSWAGFLTSEGFVSDLDGGDVAMLRYWFSERTHWLNDVFGEPEPLDSPAVPAPGFGAVDVRVDSSRRQRDEAVLRALLAR
jgi:hypothetical protein